MNLYAWTSGILSGSWSHRNRDGTFFVLFFRDQGFVLYFCGRGHPDLPAEQRDRPRDKDNKENSAENILCNIHPDRDIHAHQMVNTPYDHCRDKEQDESYNETQKYCSCKPQKTGPIGFFIHKMHGKSADINPCNNPTIGRNMPVPGRPGRGGSCLYHGMYKILYKGTP